MEIDTTNVMITLGTTAKSFDWGNFWTALFGAGFGALVAFKFNTWHESRRNCAGTLYKIDELIYLTQLAFDDLVMLKIAIKDNIAGCEIPLIMIDLECIKVKECTFLSYYSPYLLSLLHSIIVAFNGLISAINNYNNKMKSGLASSEFEAIGNIKKGYFVVIETILTCIFILHKYLNKYKVKYSKKFFNKTIPYIEDDSIILQHCPNYKNSDIYKSWTDKMEEFSAEKFGKHKKVS